MDSPDNDPSLRDRDEANPQTKSYPNSNTRRRLLGSVGAAMAWPWNNDDDDEDDDNDGFLSNFPGFGSNQSQSGCDETVEGFTLTIDEESGKGSLDLSGDASCVTERIYENTVTGPESYGDVEKSGSTATSTLDDTITESETIRNAYSISSIQLSDSELDLAEPSFSHTPDDADRDILEKNPSVYPWDGMKEDLESGYTATVEIEDTIKFHFPHTATLLDDSRTQYRADYYSPFQESEIEHQDSRHDNGNASTYYDLSSFRVGDMRYEHEPLDRDLIFTDLDVYSIPEMNLLNPEQVGELRAMTFTRLNIYNLLRRQFESESETHVREKYGDFIANLSASLVDGFGTRSISTGRGDVAGTSQELLDSSFEEFTSAVGWVEKLTPAAGGSVFFTVNHLEILTAIQLHEHTVFLAMLTDESELNRVIDLYHDALLTEKGILDENIAYLDDVLVDDIEYPYSNREEADTVRGVIEENLAMVEESRDLLAEVEENITQPPSNDNEESEESPDLLLYEDWSDGELGSDWNEEIVEETEERPEVEIREENPPEGGPETLSVNYDDVSGRTYHEFDEEFAWNEEWTIKLLYRMEADEFGSRQYLHVLLGDVRAGDSDIMMLWGFHTAGVDPHKLGPQFDRGSIILDGRGIDDEKDDAMDWENEQWYYGVCHHDGDGNYRLKAWPDGESEPSDYSAEVTGDVLEEEAPISIETSVNQVGTPATLQVAYLSVEAGEDSSDGDDSSEDTEGTGPAFFEVADMNTNSPVDGGEPLEVNAVIENVGGEEGTTDIELIVGHDPVVEDTKDALTLDPSESEEITLTFQTGEPTGDVEEFPVVVDTGAHSEEETVAVNPVG
ncbi:hypothetical protein ACFQGT_17800 [Natrialbaceae archaeon GCM10025810]|uniref:hypothetical protein n=1 Tax=Halovalidus salilacus TaxID=3075124 RepID=UPI00361F1564